ncbi:MAG: UDP-N-acetylmuramoyl-L-alanine--D-glutamate ligase [Thermodesulfovibrionales bacterium]|nr:UDP-N-acetylmuramoyl-L-alanine--D-glutamate ligase [Thermodesulfovibrionales bacterium]
MNWSFSNKKIVILGLARSGVGCANLLKHCGARITVTDIKDEVSLKNYLSELPEGIEVYLGSHPTTLLYDTDIVVLSPGVDRRIEFIKTALKKGIRVVSEVEIAYEVMMEFKEKMPFIDFLFLGITGTNGKSTTTTLLHEILKASGFDSILSGNIGTAISSEVLKIIKDNKTYEEPDISFFVTELSSFQLESIDKFKPYGSTILNITPDHLDRYESMDDYIDAKCRIFMNQTESDFLVLNADDPYTPTILQKIESYKQCKPVEVFFFSTKRKVDGIYCLDDEIRFNIPYKRLERLIIKVDNETMDLRLNPKRFFIKGIHNVENVMAASLMALLCGCTKDGLKNTVEGFKGLEHRLEFVREIDGVCYINDSKGTNVGAVAKSLEGFTTPVILIAGGRGKGSDFSYLRPYVKGRVKSLVLIGESAKKIKEALSDICDTHIVDTLESAVLKAKEMAVRGDTVLLSPACASFDMFRDFEDRGAQFKDIVMKL